MHLHPIPDEQGIRMQYSDLLLPLSIF